ncbi:hypothetical protein BFJ63_vAg13284 [Fusarium oxysporum f. sp. narcissi]|uniref:Uncharacterized protein n=2 Tax=Fusarium oxysporum TaxID=5507 RepID=A0A420RBW9_FUSOX|nr:hypothetical protein BFJ68_g6490 [Fusarium oxysporum]RKL51301.1 hypothetical protein BFJ70_g24 [Fusarium oxysporum]RYC83810.1 hypothetical protein BFJ63_vAg13284 [Fusarium oxysporum f. sp. narcissi]
MVEQLAVSSQHYPSLQEVVQGLDDTQLAASLRGIDANQVQRIVQCLRGNRHLDQGEVQPWPRDAQSIVEVQPWPRDPQAMSEYYYQNPYQTSSATGYYIYDWNWYYYDSAINNVPYCGDYYLSYEYWWAPVVWYPTWYYVPHTRYRVPNRSRYRRLT